MCFSPEASFAGGVIISAIGIFTVRKVHKVPQILFATIPLFFGFQQIAEGFVWLTLPLPDHLIIQKIFVYIFLTTALVIWPVMIPLSMLLMEKSKKKRRFMVYLLWTGGILSAYYTLCLIFFKVSPQITGFHIVYHNDFPKSLAMIATIIYLMVTITPLFMSSVKRIHLFGLMMTLSCIVTVIFFKQYLTSVWCFFAAIISGIIYWILSDLRKSYLLTRFRLLRIPVTDKEINHIGHKG
jgi:hypothetical protein